MISTFVHNTSNHNHNNNNKSLSLTTTPTTSPVGLPSATPHGIQDILSRPTPTGNNSNSSSFSSSNHLQNTNSNHSTSLSPASSNTTSPMNSPTAGGGGATPQTQQQQAATLSALGSTLPRFPFTAGPQGMYFNPAAASGLAQKLAAGLSASDLSLARAQQFYWPQMNQMVQNQAAAASAAALWRDRLANTGMSNYLLPNCHLFLALLMLFFAMNILSSPVT
jgi:hypothetical protein